ncbi:MAG: exosome complex RNA-binding protein Csl4 [Promethearchaeota archaeon]
MADGMNSNFVVVGDFLGVIEEFLSGPGTHEIDGRIYASVVGKKVIDRQKLEVRVEPVKKKHQERPKVGDVVIAEVVFTRKQTAACNIFKKGSKFLFDVYRATLHVSNMSTHYLKTVEEAFRPTDIIRAKIIKKTLSEFEITTRGPHFGVIYAECVFCGAPLVRNGNRLECNRCNYPNQRKITNDYGRIRERIENLY